MTQVQNLHQAFEILGLPEGSSRQDVEKRFEILVRQYRGRPSEQFEPIAKAYRTITSTEDQQAIDEITREKYAKFKGFAGPAERIDDFFRLHKYKVIIAAIALIAIIFGTRSYLDYRAEQDRLAKLPPIDLSFMIVGEFAQSSGKEEMTEIETGLLQPFPDWHRVTALLTYLSSEGQGQMGMAMQQKAMVQLATEKLDLFIMDKSTFEWIGGGGGLISLDDQMSSLSTKLKPDQLLKLKRQDDTDDTKEHVYGINVTNSPLAKALPLKYKDFIIGIKTGAQHPEKAMEFLKTYAASH
ncbi:hypothetical protein J2Z69_002267 [Paenibacillus shirakamiensis]|uniref:J domain-containing protein n=1 Tax=Paenibacillus shirakamiensis TaxID=1265935 RepID=A0ABS4JKU2_9BACL|nr:molecular chaperone DnaJ [Paenibacillus shirakamiensis]MBP2001224.1 hypothetical protein [Paenibacillus shirakamiensis]